MINHVNINDIMVVISTVNSFIISQIHDTITTNTISNINKEWTVRA